MDIFKAIGNILGNFLVFDMCFQVSKESKVARVLVRLDPREGLAYMIQIQINGYSITLVLDYEQLPYRFHRYHKHSQVARDFPLGFR